MTPTIALSIENIDQNISNFFRHSTEKMPGTGPSKGREVLLRN